MTTTHFMLMYDSCSGEVIKDRFATLGVNDVQVGNFDMLLNLALEYWLLPNVINSKWEYDVSKEILANSKAFWNKSIQIDETSVIDEVTKSLKLVLDSVSLEEKELPTLISSDDNRYEHYYNDLKDLHKSIENRFPLDITKAKLLKENFELKPIKNIVVYFDDMIPLKIWQKEIVELFDIDLQNKRYTELYQNIFIGNSYGLKDDIKYLQENIFTQNSDIDKPNMENIQFLVSRDPLQSVEVVAGMVQNIVKDKAAFEDITIVVPNGGFDKDFLIDTFDKFNIPLSRASKKELYDDLSTQWLKNAIYGQKELVSPMVFASLLVSPIMPYSSSVGQYLAEKALSGSLQDINFEKYDDKVKFIITTITSWQNSNSIDEMLIKNLHQVYDCLNNNENLVVHKQRFKHQLEILTNNIQINDEFNISKLSSQLSNKTIEQNISSRSYLNSVNIINENELYLGNTKHLIFLGFNDGHYPSNLGKQGVLSHIQWKKLDEKLPLCLNFRDEYNIINKSLFKKQIQSVTDTITFLSSSLDLTGDKLGISSTLSDIAYTFKKESEKELDIEQHLIWLEKADKKPFFYKEIDQERELLPYFKAKLEDINLGFDLFSLRKEKDTITNKPESPSSLEKLMISPLAWFLYRQGLESKVWGVEELDVAMQGTIAHGVYEDCFNGKYPNGDITNIDTKIQNRIQIEAPFVNQAHLALVKEQLVNEIKTSITIFKDMVDKCNIKIIQAEDQLMGEFAGIRVAGRVDVIVEVDGVKMIIDYKKSKSSKRVKRMEEGYDHQLLLYREMLSDEDAITAYFTLNDTTLVVDKDIGFISNGLFKIDYIEQECSINAKNILIKNIVDIENGIIKLNQQGDDALWDKRGVTASYTLDSTLVSIFTKEQDEEIE